jgi:valyl-tRNA synthetase
VWEWKEEYASHIREQWAKMGLSLDYFSSTFACVAIPAWSIPGSHNVSKPCILFWRIIISCDQDLFKPSGDKKAKPYSIVIPPPNVTGKLHLGHAWGIKALHSFLADNHIL